MKSKLRVFAEDHASEILTGVGIVGMASTTVLAVKATPKALMLIEEKKDELETESLPYLELIKATWRCYIPATAVGVLSITCLIGSASVNAKRSAALAAACTLSENAFRTYAEKTLEVVGQEKEHEIREFVGRQKIKDTPPPENTNSLYICTDGESIVFEGTSGRYFKSSMNSIPAGKDPRRCTRFTKPATTGWSSFTPSPGWRRRATTCASRVTRTSRPTTGDRCSNMLTPGGPTSSGPPSPLSYPKGLT